MERTVWYSANVPPDISKSCTTRKVNRYVISSCPDFSANIFFFEVVIYSFLNFGKKAMIITSLQKQPTRVVLMKTRSENMQQIYRRTLTPKCDFNKVALQSNFVEITLQHGFSPVNLLHIFRIPFTRNTSGWLLRSRVKTHLVYTGFDQNSGNCAEDKFGSNIMSSNV